jgi:hypothetical protein
MNVGDIVGYVPAPADTVDGAGTEPLPALVVAVTEDANGDDSYTVRVFGANGQDRTYTVYESETDDDGNDSQGGIVPLGGSKKKTDKPAPVSSAAADKK